MIPSMDMMVARPHEKLPIFCGKVDYMGLVSHEIVFEIKCSKCGRDNEWIEIYPSFSRWGCVECSFGIDSVMQIEAEEAFCAEG